MVTVIPPVMRPSIMLAFPYRLSSHGSIHLALIPAFTSISFSRPFVLSFISPVSDRPSRLTFALKSPVNTPIASRRVNRSIVSGGSLSNSPPIVSASPFIPPPRPAIKRTGGATGILRPSRI